LVSNKIEIRYKDCSTSNIMDYTSIKSYETYGINKNGDIIDFRTGKLKEQFCNPYGYKLVSIQNPQGYKNLMVHRLVGLTFIENPNNYKEIDHIDRDKNNNSVDNLRWANDVMQNNNRKSWSNTGEKYITYDEAGSKKNPYSCWVFQIRSEIYGRHKKRFKTSEYTIEDAIKYRDEYILAHTPK